MIAASLFQEILPPINDDCRDLLVHEDEDGGETGGDDGCRNRPPLVLQGVYHPSTVLGIRGLRNGSRRGLEVRRIEDRSLYISFCRSVSVSFSVFLCYVYTT